MHHAPGTPLKDAIAPRRDLARFVRIGICAGLALSWLVMLAYAWSAFSTLPSAERLQESRMTQIPTLATLRTLVLRSAAELATLLVLLLPAARFYLSRVLLAMIGLAAWFLATVPLTVTSMAWVHRRWLAALIVALFTLFVAGLTARVARRLTPARAAPG